MRISKLIICGLIIGLSLQLSAQDSLKTARPFQSGLYLDYGKLLQSIDPDVVKWEVGAEVILMGKWQLVGEYGQWDMQPPSAIENGSYQVEGNYQRFGLGYVPFVDTESRIGIGFRYAQAIYSDDVVVTFEPDSGLQGEVTEAYSRDNLEATWYEAVFYSDKKLNKRMTVGFTARLRFLQDYDEQESVDVLIIPGYGNPQGSRNFAVNLFLKIPF